MGKIIHNTAQFKAFVFISFLLFTLSACKKETLDQNQPVPIDYELKVYPDRIHVGESGKGTLTLRVEPVASVDWEVAELPSWLIFDKKSGTLNASGSTEIKFEVLDETGITDDHIWEYIDIVSENAKSPFLQFLLFIENVPNSIEFAGGSLSIPIDSNATNFSLYNKDNSYIYWYFENVPEHLTINQESGYFGPDSTIFFTINIDKSVYSSSGLYYDTLQMKTSLGQPHNLIITTEVYIDGSMWKFPLEIIDAEYDYNSDLIYAVTTNPNSFVIIDPENETYSSVPLVKLPTCLSVNTTTHYAAIGHDAYFSYVNLTTNQVENVYSMSVEANDIILASNGFAYITKKPNSYRDGIIKCIDINTGDEIQSIGGGYGSGSFILVIHPDGKSLYCRAIGSDDIKKYDIQNDTAIYLYESDLYWNNVLGTDMWINKTGTKIFTGSVVLSSSELENHDLMYAGRVSEDAIMRGFDDFPETNRFCGLMGSKESYFDPEFFTLDIYSLDYINPLASIDLPPFFNEKSSKAKNSFASEGRFVFINSDGTSAWVIVQAEEDYPGNDNWAIVKFNIQNY